MLNSKFECKSYKLFHFSCIKIIVLVIFEELIDATIQLKLSKAKGMVPKKKLFYPSN
jgi:hypothetical protein